MSVQNSVSYQAAVNDFGRLRRQAAMQLVLARLSGRPENLLNYEEVSSQLKVVDKVNRGAQEIPLAAIVGSVGRSQDYTRDFLPKKDSDMERWAGIKTAVADMRGILPIDVYQIGEVYFVIDGNHRVSVLRAMGSETITANVTEVLTKMPLDLEDDVDEIAAKSRYLRFLEETNLEQVCPGVDLSMTFSGQYDLLLNQIEDYQHDMAAEDASATFADALAGWCEDCYLPVVKMMRDNGMVANFPRRTEADLYMLVSEHRHELEEELGWDVDTVTAVADLSQLPKRPSVARLGERLLDAVLPIGLEDGPEPGHWRKTRPALRGFERLFADILVAVRGRPSDWPMLDLATQVARRERGQIHGLHIVRPEISMDNALKRRIHTVFNRQLANEGVRGDLVVDQGGVPETLIKWSTWNDLLVIGLKNPPEDRPRARLGSGVRRLVQRSPIPILFVPDGITSSFNRVLLAYDGSPKADEALFVTTYLAVRWKAAITVLTVETDYTASAALDRAKAYLQRHDIDGRYVLRKGDIGATVLETAVDYHTNLLIMGGFGFRPVMHAVMGSTVDKVLREFKKPILICR